MTGVPACTLISTLCSLGSSGLSMGLNGASELVLWSWATFPVLCCVAIAVFVEILVINKVGVMTLFLLTGAVWT